MGSLFYERLSEACHNMLLKNDKMLRYLREKRKISEKSIRYYKIGAFPKKLRLLTSQVSWDELIENNIIWNAEKSPFKHHPLIIPIKDVFGNTIAIGGRSLYSDSKREESGIPKYYNSKYPKTSHLFGLDKAIEAIRFFNKVFVVEGYFDVISAHQQGYKNVVATCGTIFSPRQMILLSRYTSNIVLLFDNDAPGKISSDRVRKRLDKFEHDGVNISYSFTPEGYKDLDEFLSSSKDAGQLGLERMVEQNDNIIL